MSTPTLLGRGWGRQNVETKLAKIHHKVLILIASRSTPVITYTETPSHPPPHVFFVAKLLEHTAVGPACKKPHPSQSGRHAGAPARQIMSCRGALLQDIPAGTTTTGQLLRPCRCSLFKGSGRAGEKRRCWPERFRQHGDGCACRLTTLSPPHQVCTVMTCTSKLVPSPNINQNGFHGLSTPTLLGMGLG